MFTNRISQALPPEYQGSAAEPVGSDASGPLVAPMVLLQRAPTGMPQGEQRTPRQPAPAQYIRVPRLGILRREGHATPPLVHEPEPIANASSQPHTIEAPPPRYDSTTPTYINLIDSLERQHHRSFRDWTTTSIPKKFNAAEIFLNLRQAQGENANVNESAISTLKRFVQDIPTLPHDRNSLRDKQLAAVGLARALFCELSGSITSVEAEELARHVTQTAISVHNEPHENRLAQEIFCATRAAVVPESLLNAAGMAARAGCTLGGSVAMQAVSVLAIGGHRAFKQDKTRNKVVKFLIEILEGLPNGHNQPLSFETASAIASLIQRLPKSAKTLALQKEYNRTYLAVPITQAGEQLPAYPG